MAATKPKAAPIKSDALYTMTPEVKDWIEQADSRIKYLTNENKRLKDEVEKLKSYKIWAEQRILGRSEE